LVRAKRDLEPCVIISDRAVADAVDDRALPGNAVVATGLGRQLRRGVTGDGIVREVRVALASAQRSQRLEVARFRLMTQSVPPLITGDAAVRWPGARADTGP
jgi:hypothetical protein